jgi:NitT/TauT family transport system ATP-binding protein
VRAPPLQSAQSSTSAIECREVGVEFAHRGVSQRVLDRLSLNVPSGQIVSLLGPSGCGKSTLLRVVAGLEVPSSGQVLVDGEDARLVRERLAFVFQEAALLPWRTVWQNVRLPWEIRSGRSGDRLRLAMEETLELVGFRPADWHKKPSQLSGGMKMRASIARALITNPEILLMDEPFAALDDMLRSRLNDLLLEIVARSQRTLLFVTHNISEAIYLSHAVAVMSRGRIAEWIPVDLPFPRRAELRRTPEFASFYGRVSDSLLGSEV